MHLNKIISISLFLLFTIPLFSGTHKDIQQALTQRTHVAPTIDGVLEPEVWGMAEIITDFVQYDPNFYEKPTQRTEVKILYDDNAIYVGAMLYDTSPDSILRQLGQRNASLNADAFGIRFDTYNNQLDAYTFEVAASGVQRDYRQEDRTYDGVWESAVKIHDEGWTVEMRIPYSAIRFPSTECQTWGMQIYRNIRRYREMNHWALEQRDASNRLVYWGQLGGICNIEAPPRISFTPYLSMGSSHYPHNIDGVNNLTGTFGGGLDFKYGINESFTFDMTLMPDFSQVPSDNQVKNLSAFETVHSEERPFFKESMDLFNRGGLFYSRRIGGTPVDYGSVYGELDEEEILINNPQQAKLLNAFKLSGRNNNGLAIGVFNAITDRTHAKTEDIDGNQREIQTDPRTNYNILVFDQAMANNSSAYIINTNVLRFDHGRHANVTGAGTTIMDQSNTYRINVSGAFNQLYHKNGNEDNTFEVETGFKYNASLAKAKGNFQYSISRSALSPDYNDNDMGITRRNNYLRDRVQFHYNIYEPFGMFRNWRNRFRVQNQTRYSNYRFENMYVEYTANTSTQDYLYVYHGMYFHPRDRYDYYEPRKAGMYFINPRGMGGWTGISSDYRNPFALDLRVNYRKIARFDNTNMSYRLSPRYRFNDHFSVVNTLQMNFNQNNVGYAGVSEDEVIFGYRDITTVENVFTSDYILKDDIYFSFRLRKYWSKGEYDSFHPLKENGRLDTETNYEFADTRDFNFNSFNIDFVFTWLFAPGSELNLVWKNSVLHEKSGVVNSYFDNFGLLIDSPQYNSLSLKILYHLDYHAITGWS